MTKKELEDKVKLLEARIRDLETKMAALTTPVEWPNPETCTHDWVTSLRGPTYCGRCSVLLLKNG